MYAIIELGMVDDLLNDRENSRRNLFEEAAGIAKFKKRKKETLKRLSDTDGDLDRVEDILFEIEKNLKALERQAKLAEKYRELKTEYRLRSIALARVQVKDQRESLDRLRKEARELEDRRGAIQAEWLKLEAGQEERKTKLVTSEQILRKRQETLNEAASAIRTKESDKQVRGERQRYLTDRRQQLERQIGEDQTRIAQLTDELSALSAEVALTEEKLRAAQSELGEKQQANEAQKARTLAQREQVNQQRETLQAARSGFYELSKGLEVSEAQLATLKRELERTESERADRGSNLDQLRGTRESGLKDLTEKETALAALEQQVTRWREVRTEKEQGLEALREKLAKKARDLDRVQNEYSLTKSLVDNLEGFPEAIKFLQKNSQWGVQAPLLSDLIACSEDDRLAIEYYLEPYMNHYVVDDEGQALRAVQLLGDAGKGKAHFFLLNRLEAVSLPSLPDLPGARAAMEAVEFDGKYKNLVAHLLGGVYLLDDERVSFPESDYVYLSRSGKLARRKYLLSGGSVGLFEGKRIGRAKNLEKLSAQLKSLEKERADLHEAVETAQRELQAHKDANPAAGLDSLRQEVTKANQAYTQARVELEQSEAYLTSASTRTEELAQNLRVLEDALAKGRPKLEVEQNRVATLESELSSFEQALATEQEAQAQTGEAFNAQNIALHQAQNRLDSLARERGYKADTLTQRRAALEANQAQLTQTEKDIFELLSRTEETDESLLDLYKEKENLEAAVREAEKDYYALRGEIEKQDTAQRDLAHQREQADTLRLSLTEKLNDAKLDLQSVRDRLSVEFNLDLDQLDFEDVGDIEDISSDQLRDLVQQARRKLDEMGPINPMAMEAYEEMKKRFDFITAQRADLLEAKDSLLATIEEIDAVAKETFLEAFGRIQANFQEVFRTLFTEDDTCELTLTRPDDPLDSPIEIKARPKGKRPLTINQLSGGEKTLTAVALLFSIYLLKPAPFCVFDEVDAPLDDANIDKFNRIIRTFSKDSQFIIVTHNKRTMSSTDIIYGVTMQEAGVSKLVPVDLRELKEDLSE